MVDPGISEFTFGFAFLHEQTTKYSTRLRAAPLLPSLRAEAKEGWDAKLPVRGMPFFFQFKLSKYLSDSSARHISNSEYTEPYYRKAQNKAQEAIGGGHSCRPGRLVL